MVLRKYFNYKILIALSFIFLAVYLFKTDKLEVPTIISYRSLILSFVLLFTTFIIQPLTWFKILKLYYPVGLKTAVVSDGLSVFMKYIPGKVFSILGRSQYISQRYNYPLKDITRISLESQVLIIWVGLVVGAFSLLGSGNNTWFWYIVLGIILLAMFLFTPLFQSVAKKILKMVLKREINLPHLGIKRTLRLLPVYVLYWVVLGWAFYFFQSAFLMQPPIIQSGFIFPLANTLGILILIAPGGIGIREGILATLIHLSGVDLTLAGSIAVLSRLWFLVGEVFLFITAMISNKTRI